MPEVTRTLDIEARPSAVWQWFESQENLRKWFRPDIEIDLRVGGSFRTLGADEKTWISGTVLELVPEGRLVLSWFEENAGWEHPARLVLKVTPIESGTRLTLIHDGFAGIGKSTWENTRKAYERGADQHQLLESLAAVVTTGS